MAVDVDKKPSCLQFVHPFFAHEGFVFDRFELAFQGRDGVLVLDPLLGQIDHVALEFQDVQRIAFPSVPRPFTP